ncbi:MAG TPA: tetratricopeptide repeat protein [Gemmatimonadaceae bacterium]|nr:tetratricopeptide repeat protein [Gemmatimonadaceae bacterium]
MIHRRPRWYGVAVAIAAVALPVAAVLAFLSLDAPAATSAASLPPADPGDQAFVVRRADEIRPSRDAYRRFSRADSLWRDAERAALRTATSTGAVWQPSARQQVRDRAYLLARRGDLVAAIAVLEEWVNRHPEDRESVLDLARLLNQAGRYDASIARYRQLIARRGRS